MIRIIAFLFLLATWCRADDFTTGNAAYAAGKFEDARNAYARALATEPHSNVWFNQGNASFRLNEPGRAALSYERALLAQPHHPEAAANLKFVRAKTSARVKEGEWTEKAARYANTPVATWLVLGSAWLGLSMIAGSLCGRRSRALLIFGILIALLGSAGVPALQYVRGEVAAAGIIITDRSDARTEPADRASLVESLPAASRVHIISEQGGWTYCDLPGGSRGWLPSKEVDRIVPAKLKPL